MNNLIILETVDGKRRLVPPGRICRLPGEKVVGFQNGSVASKYVFKKCSNCGGLGVYEST